MRKIVAGINMTLDGFCDHTAVLADAEIHQHYSDLISDSGVILWGRITYHLMESYWPTVVENPTDVKSSDEFAVRIGDIRKIVFSHTLNKVDPVAPGTYLDGWKNVTLAKRSIEDEVLALKQQPGKDILIGSPSLIVALTKLGLIDEYQLCVHPVVAGSGLPLFKEISDRIILKLIKTKTFDAGAIILYYEPASMDSPQKR